MKRAYTLTELLVVIAIIALLGALIFPLFARARSNARRTSCLSNLHQLGEAVTMYMADNQEHLPFHDPGFGYSTSDRKTIRRDIVNPLSGYGVTEAIMECPEAQLGVGVGAKDFPPLEVPREVLELSKRDHLLYKFRFTIDEETEAAAEGKAPMDTWRIEPQPSSVIVYCPWHLDHPDSFTQEGPERKVGQPVPGEGQSQVQYLRADGAVLRSPGSEVVIRQLPDPPIGHQFYLPQHGQDLTYLEFPGEPDKLTLTRVAH